MQRWIALSKPCKFIRGEPARAAELIHYAAIRSSSFVTTILVEHFLKPAVQRLGFECTYFLLKLISTKQS